MTITMYGIKNCEQAVRVVATKQFKKNPAFTAFLRGLTPDCYSRSPLELLTNQARRLAVTDALDIRFRRGPSLFLRPYFSGFAFYRHFQRMNLNAALH